MGKMNLNNQRIQGYDIARAVAIFGMIWVHFRIVTQANETPQWLYFLASMCEGRASAVFVVLAGVGMSLMAKYEKQAPPNKHKQRTLYRRAIFLFVIGLCYFPIWEGDILHAYGVYITIGTFFLYTSTSRLCWIILCVNMFFIALLYTIPFASNWNWETLQYQDFWTVSGMLMHIFYNGWNPVFPWVSFLLLGIIIGRLDVANSRVRRYMLLSGGGIAIFVEYVSYTVIQYLTQPQLLEEHGISADEIIALLGTQSLPPLPLYMLAAAGTAIAIISICLSIGFHFAQSKWLKCITSIGQLSLTVYIGHVVIGIFTLIVIGWTDHPQSLIRTTIATITFYILATIFCLWWTRRYAHGPLESLMRKITN